MQTDSFSRKKMDQRPNFQTKKCCSDWHPGYNVTWSFRNHSNMMISCKKHYYVMLKQLC